MRGDRVRIEYRRLPDRVTVFEQDLVADSGDVIVTLSHRSGIAKPMLIDGSMALEPESPVVWFTFPGLYYDIGRFHLRDGRFTGLYANLITPVELVDRFNWRTTDLFLDLWLGAGSGRLQLLDQAELDDASSRGWISQEQSTWARTQAERIRIDFDAGSWPPAVVHEWTLERASAVVSGHSG